MTWLVLTLIMALVAYAAGRRQGRSEGRRRGRAGAVIALRAQALASPTCPVCGADSPALRGSSTLGTEMAIDSTDAKKNGAPPTMIEID